MGRIALVCLLAIGCSASVGAEYTPDSRQLERAGSNSGGSSAGSSPLEGGGGGASGGSSGQIAGGAGGTTSVSGSANETHTGGGGTAAGGMAAEAGKGGSEPQLPKAPKSCGDGVCSITDYDFDGEPDGAGSYVADFPECHADCHTCGDGKCDVINDAWQGCQQECEVEPPKPVVLCPFPEWTWDRSANKDFVNPYRASAFTWDVGNRVHRALDRCYQCISIGCGGDPVNDYDGSDWKLIGCGC